MTRMGADAGMLRYSNVSLKDCIRVAYTIKDFQIEGPDWIGNTRFDIVAKLPEGSSTDQIPEMLQSLLADRFKLTYHRDTKEHAIYALVAEKGGPKLKPADTGSMVPAAPQAGNPGRGGVPRGGMMMMIDNEGAHLKAPATTLSRVGEMLSRFTDRPVVDMSGVQGDYEFDLVFAPEAAHGGVGGGGRGTAPGPGGDGGPAPIEGASDKAGSIYDSVKKYGLKLEARKAPMEILTVDHLEQKPTDN